MKNIFSRVWQAIKSGKGPAQGARKVSAMPTCVWLVGEDPVHGSKKVTCVGLNVWLVGNTVCPFCQKPIEWRRDDATAS